MRVIRFELKAGEVFLSFAIKMPDGSESCGKFVYREVSPISRLVWVHSFADVNGNLARHPMSPTWPLELLTTVTFADLGDKTEVMLDWVPLNANEVEIKTFRDGKPSMQGGWTGSFDQLAEYLVEAERRIRSRDHAPPACGGGPKSGPGSPPAAAMARRPT